MLNTLLNEVLCQWLIQYCVNNKNIAPIINAILKTVLNEITDTSYIPYRAVVKGLRLCLWELWHFVINTCCVVLRVRVL